jgi:signal transduction histidine kinase/ActR/RegA family two-component response regulator
MAETEAESIDVLHVDDEPDFAEMTATFLERQDERFRIDTVTSAAAGLDHLNHADYDCILSDYDMPGQNGLEFLETVRDEYPDLPFILFTGKGSEEVASEAISAGVSDYLRKGTGTERYELLANRITNAVAQHETERKERERSPKRYSACFEEAFRTIDIPTLILDADGDIVVWNEALEDLLGIDREDVVGIDSIGSVVYDGKRESILAEKVVARPQDADAVYDIERADSEYALLDAPGQPTYEDTSTVVGGTGKEIWFLAAPLYRGGEFLGVVEFVQERSHSERQRREMERLLDRLTETLAAFREGDYSARVDHDVAEDFLDDAVLESIEQVNELARMRQRLQAQVREATAAKRQLERQNERLDEFAGVVSHDLRNPLNVAEGRLELAREECDSRHLEPVERALDRMDTLVDSVLTLAREGKPAGETEPVDLGELVETCWHNVATPDAEIRSDVDRTVRADRSRLQQLLENLIRNAVEHGGEDVTVTIGELDDGFYVEDDGPGVPEDERDDVFDAGYSTTEDGTGFGLSIVKQVANAHGWTIRVTDGLEGGARFETTGLEQAGYESSG